MQVFISYASADKTVADRVCTALEAAGVSCWIAPRNIEPGIDYPAAIVEGVNAARVLVLILSAQAEASPHILTEVGHAFNGKKRIIPFRLSSEALPADLEYFLSMTQWLDAPDGATEQNLKRLTEATLDALAGKPAPRQLPPRWRRARWLAALIPALAVAAAALVYWRSPKPPAASPAPPPSAAVIAVPAGPPQPKPWVNPADGETYVWIAPGSFTMGCSAGDSECKDDEKPAHPVAIHQGFWMGQTEVTIAAYRKFAAQHGRKSPAGDGALPVTEVTWAGAKEYCAAVGGRLPTEAEWEYAARGGSSQQYYGVLGEIAWYAANSEGAPHAAGKKQPNAFGLYDMLGNVAEWVLDRYYNKYDLDAPATGSGIDLPLAGNALATARGGFWDSDSASVRVSHRWAREKDDADGSLGFRCASDRT